MGSNIEGCFSSLFLFGIAVFYFFTRVFLIGHCNLLQEYETYQCQGVCQNVSVPCADSCPPMMRLCGGTCIHQDQQCDGACPVGFMPCPENDFCIDLRVDVFTTGFYTCDGKLKTTRSPQGVKGCPSVPEFSRTLCHNQYLKELTFHVCVYLKATA